MRADERPNQTDELEGRVAQLDAVVGEPTWSDSLDELCREFVRAMSKVSARGTPIEKSEIVDPQRADRIVGMSTFIRELAKAAPWLSDGPASPECGQQWVHTNRSAWSAQGNNVPTERDLVDAGAVDDPERGGGHVRFGLYTSSATIDCPGMWRTFLELRATNVQWRKPWSTWRLVPFSGVRIYFVSCALDWVTLVRRYPDRAAGYLYPDWRAISMQFDAVHFSPAAICAVEGFRLETDSALIAPMYWDVESTLWLRWCFESSIFVKSDL